MTIERLKPEEWQLFRELSIEFVEASPDAILGNPAYMWSHLPKVWMDSAEELASSAELAAFVAKSAGAGVGFISVRVLPRVETAHITHLWVRGGHRRRGVGESLLLEGIRFARSSGVSKVSLWATISNEAAVRLYVRHGFKRTDAKRYLRGDSGALQFRFEMGL